MKKAYLEPQLKFLQLQTADIMTASAGPTITGSIDPAENDEIWDLAI